MVECNLKAKLSGSVFAEHDREDINTNTRLQKLENADATLNNKMEDLNNRCNTLTKNVEEFQNEYDNIKNNKNYIPYKSASVTIANANLPTDETYRQLAEAGLSQTLCPMVNIASMSSETFTLMNRNDVVNAITYAKSKGVPTDVIKPHIGINWSDSTYRPGLNPTDHLTFLNNWKEVLLHYAQICNEQDIEWLCVGCEMDKLVKPEYEYVWNDLVSDIRTAYPNLKLTYATTTADFMSYENATLNCVDAIGVNLYLQWSTKPYNSDMTYEDIMPSFFDSYAPISGGFRANDRINEISFKYKKPIFITEFGVIPRVTGIQILKPEDYDIRDNEDYDISKIVIEAFFNSLCKNNNLTGFSIWHVKEPFNFFKYDDNIGNSVATDMIKEYIQRGDI